jgi:hypothetical protein
MRGGGNLAAPAVDGRFHRTAEIRCGDQRGEVGVLVIGLLDAIRRVGARSDGPCGPPPNPQTVRQVHEALSARRDLAYTTVMNVLQRLAKKTSWHSTAMTGHTATHPCMVATNSSPG